MCQQVAGILKAILEFCLPETIYVLMCDIKLFNLKLFTSFCPTAWWELQRPQGTISISTNFAASFFTIFSFRPRIYDPGRIPSPLLTIPYAWGYPYPPLQQVPHLSEPSLAPRYPSIYSPYFTPALQIQTTARSPTTTTIKTDAASPSIKLLQPRTS